MLFAEIHIILSYLKGEEFRKNILCTFDSADIFSPHHLYSVKWFDVQLHIPPHFCPIPLLGTPQNT